MKFLWNVSIIRNDYSSPRVWCHTWTPRTVWFRVRRWESQSLSQSDLVPRSCKYKLFQGPLLLWFLVFWWVGLGNETGRLKNSWRTLVIEGHEEEPDQSKEFPARALEYESQIRTDGHKTIWFSRTSRIVIYTFTGKLVGQYHRNGSRLRCQRGQVSLRRSWRGLWSLESWVQSHLLPVPESTRPTSSFAFCLRRIRLRVDSKISGWKRR